MFKASKYLSSESVREPNVDCACLLIIAIVDGGSGTASNVPARGRSRGVKRRLAAWPDALYTRRVARHPRLGLDLKRALRAPCSSTGCHAICRISRGARQVGVG